MHRADGPVPGGELMVEAQLRRQIIRDGVAHFRQCLSNPAGQLAGGDAGGQRIDRHDAAGAGVTAFRFKDWVNHAPAGAVQLQCAVKHITLSHQQLLGKIGLVEEGEGEGGGVVEYSDVGHAQPFSDIACPRRLSHDSADADGFPFGGLSDGPDLSAILIGAGIPPSQISQGGQPQPGQRFCLLCADAVQYAHALFGLCHDSASLPANFYIIAHVAALCQSEGQRTGQESSN